MKKHVLEKGVICERCLDHVTKEDHYKRIEVKKSIIEDTTGRSKVIRAFNLCAKCYDEYMELTENFIKSGRENNDETIVENNTLSDINFTWDLDKEDPEIVKNGLVLTWLVGRSSAIQKFIEALSYKIGYKCDFAFTAGRAHIDVPRDGYAEARKALEDTDFIKPFIVPYSNESYDNGTYLDFC